MHPHDALRYSRLRAGRALRRNARSTGRATDVDSERACHMLCNATVPPGPALGLCHAQCGLGAAAAHAIAEAIDVSAEEACHRICNATVPPGPALGACHVRCALGERA